MRESSHVSDDLRRTAVPVPLAGALRTRERNRPVSDSRLAKHLTATVWWREPDRTPVAPPQGRRGRVRAGGVAVATKQTASISTASPRPRRGEGRRSAPRRPAPRRCRPGFAADATAPAHPAAAAAQVLFILLRVDLERPGADTARAAHAGLRAVQRAVYGRGGTVQKLLQDDKGLVRKITLLLLLLLLLLLSLFYY